MKKVIVLMLCCLFILSGCGSKKSVDLKTIESALLASKYYSNHEVVSKETFEKKYDIKLGNDDVLIIISKSYDNPTIALIAKNSADTKKELDSFATAYNSQWVKMNYFPEAKALVEKALYKTIGDYIVYIVSEDNDAVLKIINL